jgi:hypothetical protein
MAARPEDRADQRSPASYHGASSACAWAPRVATAILPET